MRSLCSRSHALRDLSFFAGFSGSGSSSFGAVFLDFGNGLTSFGDRGRDDERLWSWLVAPECILLAALLVALDPALEPAFDPAADWETPRREATTETSRLSGLLLAADDARLPWEYCDDPGATLISYGALNETYKVGKQGARHLIFLLIFQFARLG